MFTMFTIGESTYRLNTVTGETWIMMFGNMWFKVKEYHR